MLDNIDVFTYEFANMVILNIHSHYKIVSSNIVRSFS